MGYSVARSGEHCFYKYDNTSLDRIFSCPQIYSLYNLTQSVSLNLYQTWTPKTASVKLRSITPFLVNESPLLTFSSNLVLMSSVRTREVTRPYTMPSEWKAWKLLRSELVHQRITWPYVSSSRLNSVSICLSEQSRNTLIFSVPLLFSFCTLVSVEAPRTRWLWRERRRFHVSHSASYRRSKRQCPHLQKTGTLC